MKDLDITKAVQSELTKLVSPEVVLETIRKNVSKAVEDEIEELFSYHGNFRKEIKEFVKEKITIDLSSVTVPNHNDIIIAEIQKVFNGMKDTDLRIKAQGLVEDLVAQAPKKSSISEIVEEYKNYVRSEFSSEIDELDVDYDDGPPSRNVYIEASFDADRGRSWSTYNWYCLKLETGIEGAKSGKVEISFSDSYYGTDMTICIVDIDGKKAGSDSDLARWSEMSQFEKFLYKIDKAGSLIDKDNDKIDKHIEVEADCSC